MYLVEGGEVVGQVNNFRFNGSPLDLIRRATEVGATERILRREWNEWFARTAMPPMRVPDFNMSSVSPASEKPNRHREVLKRSRNRCCEGALKLIHCAVCTTRLAS
ncbi:MAG: metallopeptidase TldD-related protein [Pseudonocardiaceae bacterium]